ncbi:MAG: iron-sulfur cluster assembly scaffold protein [Clostridia bacterium]|nr:iron-sulfur cluster assembly scaffold protein [Clostridia bacterium]
MDEYKVESLFEDMKFFGKLDKPDFEGKSLDTTRGEILYLQVNIQDSVIKKAKYRIVSKSVVYAICEIFTQKIIKKDIKTVFKNLIESYLEIELGDIPSEYLYVIDLYRNALKDIVEQYREKNPEQKKEQPFKRLLNFDDEEDLDVLSEDQVKKLLNAVDDLKNDKDKNKYENFDKVKESVIGKKENKIINVKKFDKSRLLDDNVPDFDYYVDNTIGLEFEDREIEVDEVENLTFNQTLSTSNNFEDLDIEFEKNLNFSNYNFDDSKNNEDKDKED